MITRIREFKKQGNGESIMTFYFPSLYTKLPQSKLLRVLYEWTDLFSLEDSITVNRFGTKVLNQIVILWSLINFHLKKLLNMFLSNILSKVKTYEITRRVFLVLTHKT